MGFFERLVGKAAANAVKDAFNSQYNAPATPAPQPQVQPQQIPVAPAPQMPELNVFQKLDQVLASDFAGYQVAKAVSPRALGDNGANTMPYAYVISSNGQVKLLIMICDKNTCSTRGYHFSKEFAASRGYTLINFLLHSPNEIGYIRDRLHQYL